MLYDVCRRNEISSFAVLISFACCVFSLTRITFRHYLLVFCRSACDSNQLSWVALCICWLVATLLEASTFMVPSLTVPKKPLFWHLYQGYVPLRRLKNLSNSIEWTVSILSAQYTSFQFVPSWSWSLIRTLSPPLKDWLRCSGVDSPRIFQGQGFSAPSPSLLSHRMLLRVLQ